MFMLLSGHDTSMLSFFLFMQIIWCSLTTSIQSKTSSNYQNCPCLSVPVDHKCQQFLQTTDTSIGMSHGRYVPYLYKTFHITFRLHVYYLTVITGSKGTAVELQATQQGCHASDCRSSLQWIFLRRPWDNFSPKNIFLTGNQANHDFFPHHNQVVSVLSTHGFAETYFANIYSGDGAAAVHLLAFRHLSHKSLAPSRSVSAVSLFLDPQHLPNG